MALYGFKHFCRCEVHLSSSSQSFSVIILSFLLLLFIAHHPKSVTSQRVGDNRGSPVAPGMEQSCKSCTCSSRSIIEYFEESFITAARLYTRAPRFVEDAIDRFECRSKIQLPPTLSIQMSESTDPMWYFNKRKRKMKRLRRLRRSVDHDLTWRRRRARMKRQLVVGDPDPEKFAEVVAKIPRLSSHHYIPIGQRATLHCFGGADEQGVQEDLYGYNRRFEWLHANGMPITGPHVLLDEYTGDFTINSVRLADVGIYNCTVVFDEEGEGTEMKTFQSQLDVVTAPMIWLKFGISYSVFRCRHRELLLIQDHIPEWIHQFACHFCPVRNVSVTCVNLGEPSAETGKYVQISFALSTLGFERLLMSYEHYSYLCDMACLEKMHLKILNVTESSIMSIFELQINVEPVDEAITTYTPDVSTRKHSFTLGCPAGFFTNYKLCFPCAAGKYSPHGKDQCFPCPEKFFQPNPGSSACFPCPRGYATLGEGARSQTECVLEALISSVKFAKFHWTMVVLAVLLILLIVFILVICFCYPDSSIAKCLRFGWCCKGKGSSSETQIRIPEREMLIMSTDDNTDVDGLEEIKEKKFTTFTSSNQTSEDESEGRSRYYDKLMQGAKRKYEKFQEKGVSAVFGNIMKGRRKDGAENEENNRDGIKVIGRPAGRLWKGGKKQSDNHGKKHSTEDMREGVCIRKHNVDECNNAMRKKCWNQLGKEAMRKVKVPKFPR